MEKNKILPKPFNNVFSKFYYQHESIILETRKKLYSKLVTYDFNIAVQVQKILENRVNSTSSPLMGELYPCIINELVPGLKKEVALDIAVSWLATYLLIIIVDNSHDKEEEINGIIFAALHLEASKLLLFISNKEWIEKFYQAALEAMQGQIKDIKLQKVTNHDEEKLKTAKQKNKILSALAIVYASHLDEKKANFITDVTDSFLLGFQMLDDMLDFESDYHEKNRTFLLNGISPEEKALNRQELLEYIIISKKLEETIEQVLLSLNKTRQIISKNVQSCNDNSSIILFDEVEKEALLLMSLAKNYEPIAKKTVKLKKSIDRVDRHIGYGGGAT